MQRRDEVRPTKEALPRRLPAASTRHVRLSGAGAVLLQLPSDARLGRPAIGGRLEPRTDPSPAPGMGAVSVARASEAGGTATEGVVLSLKCLTLSSASRASVPRRPIGRTLRSSAPLAATGPPGCMAASSKRQEVSETGFAVRPPFGKR